GAPSCSIFHRYRGRGCGALMRVADALNATLVERRVAAGGVDVYHPTYYHTLLARRPRPPAVVLTVHDMIHELFDQVPDRERLCALKRRAVDRADVVVVPSMSTRGDLQRLIGVPDDRIVVIPHGSNFTGDEPGDGSVEFPDRFVLFVGSRWSYKNFRRFFEAMARIMADDPELHLVCAGGGGFTKEELGLFAKAGLAERVHARPGHDRALAAAYRRASVFVFPSLYEGFGMPVLEAMAFGCPVVASRVSSLPEVGGDAALYFDPLDLEDIAGTVSAVLRSDDLRARLSAEGRRRASRFSWDAAVRAHADLYRTIGG
ncbi:MAG: glycosyltransferase family 4 protein, partial [Coriobacteriia bacterium]|nr:glycosyltransferase family 4 protein [Coriobacteriia bacterium]